MLISGGPSFIALQYAASNIQVGSSRERSAARRFGCTSERPAPERRNLHRPPRQGVPRTGNRREAQTVGGMWLVV